MTCVPRLPWEAATVYFRVSCPYAIGLDRYKRTTVSFKQFQAKAFRSHYKHQALDVANRHTYQATYRQGSSLSLNHICSAPWATTRSPHKHPTMTPSVTASWEAQIDERVSLGKFCLRSGSFTAIHTVLANDVLAETDRAKALRLALAPAGEERASDTTTALNSINVAAVNGGQTNYVDFSKKVENLKNTDPDADAWEKIVDAAADDAKKKSDKIIDDAADKAKAVIRKLPPDARVPAANVFKTGLGKVMGFFQSVWNGINTVINSIANFIRGVWDKLKAAAQAVADAAKSAINWISGLFRLAAFDATWPSNFSATSVNREIALVLDDLSQQGFEVGDFSIQKTANGWVVHTALNSSNGQNLGGDVDVFWKRSITTKTSAVPSIMAW